MDVNSTLVTVQLNSPCKGCEDRFTKVSDKYGIINCKNLCTPFKEYHAEYEKLKELKRKEAEYDLYMNDKKREAKNEGAIRKSRMQYGR